MLESTVSRLSARSPLLIELDVPFPAAFRLGMYATSMHLFCNVQYRLNKEKLTLNDYATKKKQHQKDAIKSLQT